MDIQKQVIAGFFQIIVAVLGSFMPLVIERFKRRGEPERDAVTGQPKSASKPRHLLDLAILLAYSAFLSAILCHSILVSGRAPNFSDGAILLAASSISFIAGFVVYLAWRRGIGELMAGAMSFASIIVLLIAPGHIWPTGPASGLEPSLPLSWPLLTLTFATAVSVIYVFGNPLARDVTPSRRRRVGAGLSILAFGTAVILAYDFVYQVKTNPNAPQFQRLEKKANNGTTPDDASQKYSPDQELLGRQILKQVRALDLQKRGIFYQVASESVLSKEYQAQYFDVAKEFPLTEPVDTENSQPSAAAKTDDSDEEDAPVGGRSSPPKPAATTTAAATATAASTRAPASPKPVGTLPVADRAKATKAVARYPFITLVEKDIEPRDTPSLIAYWTNRMAFVHPIPLTEEIKQVPVPIPGLTAKARYAALSEYRLLHVFQSGWNLPWEISDFSYPSVVATGYRLARDPSFASMRSRMPYIREVQTALDEASIAPRLFPKFLDNDDWNFQMQMAMPVREDAYLAYVLAMTLAEKEERDADVSAALKSFRNLSLEQRRAFTRYVATRPAEAGMELLRGLSDQKADLTGFPSTFAGRIGLVNRFHDAVPCRGDADTIQSVCNQLVRFFPKMNRDRENLVKLISAENQSEVSVSPIFASAVLDFAGKAPRNPASAKRLLDIIADPVTVSLRTVIDKNKWSWITPELLDNFAKLTPANRDQLLLHLAITLYQGAGDYSLSPIESAALQTDLASPTVAVLCATMLMLPLSVIAIALAAFAARKLVERDRTRLLVTAELESGQAVGDIGLPVELHGRESLVDRIRRLGGRGWSTIALVGRRGVGKSRVLHEIYRPSSADSERSAVSVWIAAPTSYNEAEFVESVFERLVLRTDHAVAEQLQAKPLQVRLLERSQAAAGAWMFLTIITAVAVLLANAFGRPSARPDLTMAWVPVVILVAIASTILVRFLAEVQPVDLSPWLERDRSHGASLVLLYREAREALQYLVARRRAESRVVSSRFSTVVGATVGFIIGSLITSIILIIEDPPTTFESTVAYGAGIISLIATIMAFRFLGRKLDRGENAGSSVMSLTAAYRRFAGTVVHHVASGALGKRNDVVICIDELDKIVEEDSVREFLRKMKGIFEVPGVYYYITIAEDTLARLYLASADGKNEVDSSLDHIVRVPPLNWTESRALVKAYFQRRGFADVDLRVMTTIAAVSAGVPRDVIRRCDEMLAGYVGKPEGTLTVVDTTAIANAVRRDRVELACEREGWPAKTRERLLAPAADAAVAIEGALRTGVNDRTKRLLAMLWTLCACELAASSRASDDEWERLFRLGYELTTRPIDDIFASISEIGSQKTASPPPDVPTDAPPRRYIVPYKTVASTGGNGRHDSTPL